MKAVKTIRFSFTKRGNKIAHKYFAGTMRSFRMPLNEAELMVSTGKVKTVINGPDFLKAGVEIVDRAEHNGVTFLLTMNTGK